MANPKAKYDLVPLDDYLDGEERAQIRHEFVNGMVYAMADGTVRHDTIAGNIAAALNMALPERCRATVGNVQLGLHASDAGTWFLYPDVFVFCDSGGDLDLRRDDASVVFEVLSHSTERSDRHEKFERSKTLPTLQDYVQVEQLQPRLEIYRRRNGWKQEFIHSDDLLVLESIQQTLNFEQIYRRVKF